MAIRMIAYMNYDVRPTEQWTTTLEFDHEGTLDSGLVYDTALNFANGLSGLLLSNVIIDRVTASTWVPDSEPYDPANVRTIPIGINGEREFLLTDPVDDDLVLFIRKTVDTGRTGKVLLRGCMVTADLAVYSGSWILKSGPIADFTEAIDNWATLMIDSALACALVGSPLLGITYPAVAEGVKQVPIKNYSPTPTIRPVRDFALVGPTERQDTQ